MSTSAYTQDNIISSSALFAPSSASAFDPASASPLYAAATAAAPDAASTSLAAAQAAAHAARRARTDPELENKVKKASERISENLHICANEPSLAFYRLAEHVRKALPPTVESRKDVRRLNQQLRGAYQDAEYGLDAVKTMGRAAEGPLAGAVESLKNAIFLQQQIKYEQQKSRLLLKTTKPSGGKT